MAEDWIQERAKKYRERIAKEKSTEAWQRNAFASYDSFCNQLGTRLKQDLEVYNYEFSADEKCKAIFNDTSRGFEIVCRNKMASVIRESGSTIIRLAWSSADKMQDIRHDKFDIAPDSKGTIRYKHDERFLSDVSEASEIVLDPILCR